MGTVRRMPRQWVQVTASAWTPASLSGIVSWYKADDAASITQSSGAVSQWNDQVGGFHLTQASGTAQPTTGTRTQNGLNVIDFDGSTDYLANASIASTQPTTILVVAKNDTTNATFLIDGVSGSGRNLIEMPGTGNVWRMYAGTSEEATTAPAPSTTAHQSIAVFNGASSVHYVDGSTYSLGGTPGAQNLSGITVGTDNTHVVNWLDGFIAELVVMTGAISGADRTLWNTYCARWGL